MADTITIHTDDETERALDVLSSGGHLAVGRHPAGSP
jgi:hypothetical protein